MTFISTINDNYEQEDGSNSSSNHKDQVIEAAAVAEDVTTTDYTLSNTGDDEENNNNSKCGAYCSWKKAVVGLVLLGFIAFVIADALTNNYVKTGILAFLEWIEGNPAAGVLAFVAVYFAATVCFVPGSILTLGAGFVFSASFDSLAQGVLLGSCAVFVGASLGAIASFLLGRYLFRDGFVGRLTQQYSVFEALDNALSEKGFRIMMLLRLSPIVPFNALNYIAGVTGIKLIHYCIACSGMLPGTVLYVFLGASAGSLSEIGGGDEEVMEEEEENKAVTISVIVAGVVFGFLAVALTSYYAKQELNKVIAKKEEEAAAAAAAQDANAAEPIDVERGECLPASANNPVEEDKNNNGETHSVEEETQQQQLAQ